MPSDELGYTCPLHLPSDERLEEVQIALKTSREWFGGPHMRSVLKQARPAGTSVRVAVYQRRQAQVLEQRLPHTTAAPAQR